MAHKLKKNKDEQLKEQQAIQKHIDCIITCATCGSVLRTKSIKKEISVDICSKCHPFYIGKNTFQHIGKAKEFLDKMKRREENLKKINNPEV